LAYIQSNQLIIKSIQLSYNHTLLREIYIYIYIYIRIYKDYLVLCASDDINSKLNSDKTSSKFFIKKTFFFVDFSLEFLQV
jgi:hypothetical protein